MVFGWGISRRHVGYMSFRRHSRRTRPMPKRKRRRVLKPATSHISRKGVTARRIEVYSAAYKIAWKQIPPDERRARPEMSLRIHASIRRQLKAGANNPDAIAFVALNDALVTDTQ